MTGAQWVPHGHGGELVRGCVIIEQSPGQWWAAQCNVAGFLVPLCGPFDLDAAVRLREWLALAPAPMAPQPAPSRFPDVDAFLAGWEPRQAARARAALLARRRVGHDYPTVVAIIRDHIAGGSTIIPGTDGRGRRLSRPSGAYNDERQLGKWALDFAAWLIARRDNIGQGPHDRQRPSL